MSGEPLSLRYRPKGPLDLRATLHPVRRGGGEPTVRWRDGFWRATRTPLGPATERLRQAVIKDQNVFEVLMDAVRVCSLGQITHALFEVGGQYRRSM